MNAPELDRRTGDSTATAVEVANLKGEMHTGFADLGGKIDTLIAEQRAERDARHALGLAQQKQLDDHESRIRGQEERKTVAPWQLWLVASGTLGLLIAGTSVVLSAVKA